MLTLTLDSAYRPANGWQRDRTGWACGPNRITPLEHPALETMAYSDGVTSVIIVRERLRGRPEQDAGLTPIVLDASSLRQRLDEALGWPLEYVLIRAAADGRYDLHAGLWGAAPVYLAAQGSVLHGSWDITTLVGRTHTDRLNRAAIAAHLAGVHRYSTQTLFTDVAQLTERAHAVFDAAGLAVQYPTSAAHAAPRQLAADADPIAGYDRILTAALARWQTPGGLLVEVSGGLDSANVALAAAALAAEPACAYGLLVGGHAVDQQVRRRGELLQLPLFQDWRDITVPALEWSPFCPAGPRARGVRYDPRSEPYSEALDAVLSEAASITDARVVLTGIGGDELMSLREWERDHPQAGDKPASPLLTPAGAELLSELSLLDVPASVVSEPSLLAAAARAPVFLRRGMWPVNPLCTPELVRFCEWLPESWRRGRRLHRERLVRAGLPPLWPHPQLRENFADVMPQGLRWHGLVLLDNLTKGAVLADLGLIDPPAVLDCREAYLRGAAVLGDYLYEVINVELALRRLVDQVN